MIPHGCPIASPSPLFFFFLTPVMENTCRHSLFVSGPRWCDAQQQSVLEIFVFLRSSFFFYCFGSPILRASHQHRHHWRSVPSGPLLFGSLPDCYLAFRWRLAAPLGEHECACQQEFIGGNRGRWRMDGWWMVSVVLQLFSPLCVRMSPLIQSATSAAPPHLPCSSLP